MDSSRQIREGDQTWNSSWTSGEFIIFPSSINQPRVKDSLNPWNTRQTWTESASGKDLPFSPVDQKRATAIENDTLGFCFSFFLFSPMITPSSSLSVPVMPQWRTRQWVAPWAFFLMKGAVSQECAMNTHSYKLFVPFSSHYWTLDTFTGTGSSWNSGETQIPDFWS